MALISGSEERGRSRPGLSFLLLILCCYGCSQVPPKKFNIVFVMVDTLRADHLSCYGYERPTSPSIDAFAKEHLLFLNNRSQAACTFPSVNSLLTSRDPFEFVSNHLESDELGIPDESPYLPRILKANGYRTIAISASPVFKSNPGRTNPSGGYGSGFDEFHDDIEWGAAWRVNEVLRDRLKAGEQPFFAYLHYIDPHDPYMPPEESRYRFAKRSRRGRRFIRNGNPNPIEKELFEGGPEVNVRDGGIGHLVDLYDDEIAYVDKQFAELLDFLKSEGLYENTIMVFASDHGEAFMEHNDIKHCHTLYDTLIRTPLIIRLPGSDYYGVREQLTQNMDIVPTLLDYLGIDSSSYGFHGRSLRPVIEREEELHDAVHSSQSEHRSVADLRYKLIQTISEDKIRLFDIQADSGEQNDIALEKPDLAEGFVLRLDEWSKRVEGASTEKIMEAEEAAHEKLRALGYLQ